MNEPQKRMAKIIVNSLRLSLYRNNWSEIVKEVSREMELHDMHDSDRAIDSRSDYAERGTEDEAD